MNKFFVVIEKAKNNYSAYSPDLPGCIATGKTVQGVEKKMYKAIDFHLEGLKEDKIPVPKSMAIAEYIVI